MGTPASAEAIAAVYAILYGFREDGVGDAPRGARRDGALETVELSGEEV